MTGCNWVRQCELNPRMTGEVMLNNTESTEEPGAQKFRLYLTCPI